MIRKFAIYLVGERQMGDMGYYRRLNRVVHKLKEAIATVVLFTIVVVSMVAMLYAWATEETGYYVPEYVNDNGELVDIDGDGDVYDYIEE